jgi:short-subunit dehydrogenase
MTESGRNAPANGGASARATALVTGASSGIGEAFARRFAADGLDVVVVARRRDRLEALAADLRGAGVEPTVIAADLTDAADLARVERAAAECGTLRYLVNNAGAAGYMPFVDLPPDQAESLVRLHIVATTRLTRAALPGMVERGAGVVINVSSGLSFSGALPSPPLPRRAVYAAAKAYLNTFSEVVANELRGTGVVVQALCPGLVRTEFHQVAGIDVSQLPGGMQPGEVVDASLAGVTLGETLCVPGLIEPALIDEFSSVRGRIFASLRGGVVAERYRAG